MSLTSTRRSSREMLTGRSSTLGTNSARRHSSGSRAPPPPLLGPDLHTRGGRTNSASGRNPNSRDSLLDSRYQSGANSQTRRIGLASCRSPMPPSPRSTNSSFKASIPRAGRGDCSPSARTAPLARDELLSLLLSKAKLTDMCPDAYRLDLSRKEDMRYLYEMRHRVDPELHPCTRPASRARVAQIYRSRVFDGVLTPREARRPAHPPALARRPSDGMGALARFLLGADGRAEGTAPRGRRTQSAGAPTRPVSAFFAQPDAQTPERAGTRRVWGRPREQLGADLMARQSAAPDEGPRGRRTLRAVRQWESTQPEGYKVTPRAARVRSHSAASDSDIFGVRRRREACAAEPRPRAASARSNDPFGLHNDAVWPQSATTSTMHAPRRLSAPFGNEAEEKGTPTRRHGRSNQNVSEGTPRPWRHAGGEGVCGNGVDRMAQRAAGRTSTFVLQAPNTPSPRRAGRQAHLDSARMRSILTWE